MLGSDIIDAAIGLFLVYFLFSLLCSATNEWIVGHLRGLRAKTLETAMERMLGSTVSAGEFFKQPLIRSLAGKDEAKPSYLSGAAFVDGLLALIKDKADQVAKADSTKVVPAAALAAMGTDLPSLHAVLDAIPGASMQPIVKSLIAGAANPAEARQKLEKWFDEGMDRATGWYKRHVQFWLAGLAAGVVVLFNVDTFTMARELMSNSKLRAALVASAQETVKQSMATNDTTTASNTVAAIEKKITDLKLPIGWPWLNETNDIPLSTRTAWLRPGEGWLMKLGGLLVTAAAVSLGAPFWFDLLGKLVNLRAAGKKPEPAIPEPAKEKK